MVTKKRLLFIIPTLRGAGAERVLIDILNRFDYNRYEVDLLLYDNKGELFEHVNDKVRTHVLYTKRRPKIPLIIRKTKRATFSERNVPKIKRNDSQAQNEAYL